MSTNIVIVLIGSNIATMGPIMAHKNSTCIIHNTIVVNKFVSTLITATVAGATSDDLVEIQKLLRSESYSKLSLSGNGIAIRKSACIS